MSILLSGKPVAAALQASLQDRVAALTARGVTPTLAVLRIGDSSADGSYLRRIETVCTTVGAALRRETLPADTTQATAEALLRDLNADPGVHGILLLRPVPKQLDEAALCRLVDPGKDVDGMSPASAAALYLGSGAGFPPCTAAACMELLRFYRLPVEGKRAVVVGRSTVVGKPLALLLLEQNATVSVCHSKTEDLAAVCRAAELLVAATGRPGLITAAHVKPGAVVLDVGTHWDEAKGRLLGDVDFEAVSPIAGAITPVPGGVGAVTATMLAANTVTAAEQHAAR